MQPLKDAIIRLRRELAEAFADASTPGGPAPKSPQATLDLTVALGTGGWQVLEASDSSVNPAQTHRLHLELTLGTVAPSSVPSTHAPGHGSWEIDAKSRRNNDAPATLLDRLSAVFGPPGFDSSARASVFRECLESLSQDEVRAAILVPAGSPSADVPQAIRQANHQIGRLLERGPAGTVQGRELLKGILAEAEPATLLNLILREWKTQDDWIDRSGN